MTYLLLFYEFFKTGLFAIGGDWQRCLSYTIWPINIPNG